MSPYVEVVTPEPDGEEPPASPDEPFVHCTECEYTAPKTEFLPENYR